MPGQLNRIIKNFQLHFFLNKFNKVRTYLNITFMDWLLSDKETRSINRKLLSFLQNRKKNSVMWNLISLPKKVHHYVAQSNRSKGTDWNHDENSNCCLWKQCNSILLLSNLLACHKGDTHLQHQSLRFSVFLSSVLTVCEQEDLKGCLNWISISYIPLRTLSEPPSF